MSDIISDKRDMTMIPVLNPATGKQIGAIVDGGKAAVDRAVKRARASFDSGVWSRMPAPQRTRILWKLADLIEDRIGELSELEALDVGMSRMLARGFISTGLDMLRYYAGWCTKIHGQSTDLVTAGWGGPNAEYHAYTTLEPIGVVGLIIPWNGPVFCALVKLAPALAAGCSCILKPAEEAPLAVLKLEALMAEAGIPDGVATIVTGYGETTGAAMVAHPGIDKIAFTGSTEVGKHIVRAAAGNLKRVTLELGGKSPVLIYDDADLAKAIPGAAMGVFLNSGQSCTAGSRVFVQCGVYDQVVKGIAAIAKNLRLGGSEDPDANLGPLISAKQLARVKALVDEGCDNGARLAAGGNALDRTGFFFEPTVVSDVSTDMRLYREEIFGPVVVILPFDDEEEVIAEAKDTEYGLAAAIWTRDISRAHRMARRMDAGTVWVNCQSLFNAAIPFGGFKQSGWGTEYGWKGIEIYLRSKSVVAQL